MLVDAGSDVTFYFHDNPSLTVGIRIDFVIFKAGSEVAFYVHGLLLVVDWVDYLWFSIEVGTSAPWHSRLKIDIQGLMACPFDSS